MVCERSEITQEFVISDIISRKALCVMTESRLRLARKMTKSNVIS